MNQPTPVQIVRPYVSGRIAIARLIGLFLSPLLAAWVFMVLLPVVTPWSLSFWHSVAAVVLVRCLHPIPTPLDYWSKAGTKP